MQVQGFTALLKDLSDILWFDKQKVTTLRVLFLAFSGYPGLPLWRLGPISPSPIARLGTLACSRPSRLEHSIMHYQRDRRPLATGELPKIIHLFYLLSLLAATQGGRLVCRIINHLCYLTPPLATWQSRVRRRQKRRDKVRNLLFFSRVFSAVGGYLWDFGLRAWFSWRRGQNLPRNAPMVYTAAVFPSVQSVLTRALDGRPGPIVFSSHIMWLL